MAVTDAQFTAVDFSTAATQTVVAAPPAGKRIYVLGVELYNGVATAQTIQFRSGANNLTGVMAFPSAVGGAIDLPISSDNRAWFFTDPATALTMVQSAATQVGGVLTYIIA